MQINLLIITDNKIILMKIKNKMIEGKMIKISIIITIQMIKKTIKVITK